jgi:hypothetical protein
MRICSQTTGSQQAPASTYSARLAAIQGVVHGSPSRWAIHRPVTGCTSTVGVVKSQSASTTWRLVAAMWPSSPPRSAIHL